MSIRRQAYEFRSGSEIIGFLTKEGKPLKGEVVIPDEDTGLQDYYSGTFALHRDTETGLNAAVFEAKERYKDEVSPLAFTAETISQDSLGYVLSRKSLAKK